MPNAAELRVLISHVFYTSAAVSFFLNGLSIFLAVTKSPKAMGAYKHLMVVISVYEILYAMLDAFLIPMQYGYGSAIVELVNVNDKPFGRPTIKFLSLIYWFSFGISLAMMSLHFIYRYLVLSKHHLLSSFHSWKFVLWLLIPASMGLVWAVVACFLCGPDQKLADILRDGLLETFDENIDDFEYIGCYVYSTSPDGAITLNYRSIIALAVLMMTITSSLSIIVYFGVRCYQQMSHIMESASSSRYHSLQYQLLYSLIAQTLVPLFVVHLPILVFLISAVTQFSLGSNSVIVSLSIILYPSLEPLPNLFIIKPYRRAIIDLIKCRKNKHSISYASTSRGGI